MIIFIRKQKSVFVKSNEILMEYQISKLKLQKGTQPSLSLMSATGIATDFVIYFKIIQLSIIVDVQSRK